MSSFKYIGYILCKLRCRSRYYNRRCFLLTSFFGVDLPFLAIVLSRVSTGICRRDFFNFSSQFPFGNRIQRYSCYVEYASIFRQKTTSILPKMELFRVKVNAALHHSSVHYQNYPNSIELPSLNYAPSIHE